jgi:predicted RNase H-like HicB family nuclease
MTRPGGKGNPECGAVGAVSARGWCGGADDFATLPSLGLVTRGEAVESALEAARDLGGLWVEELRDRGEPVLKVGRPSREASRGLEALRAEGLTPPTAIIGVRFQ